MILPAFNEEANIGPMVEACLEVLPGLAEDFEVIVVDDGSRDGTSTVAEEWVERAPHNVRLLVHDRNLGYGAAIRTGLQHASMGLVFYTDADRQFDVAEEWVERAPHNVRLLVHDRNLGYGAAIRTGLQHASMGLVFYTDADRQFDVAELTYFLPMIREFDLVVGFRVYRYDTVVRCLISWTYNRIVAVLFRVRVRDVDCAFKLMRAEVRDKLPLQTDDFFIDTEIVACARKWNFRVGEKGVRHYPRVAGETTVAPSDVLRTLRTIARMWRRIYMPSVSQRREAEEIGRRVTATEYLPAGTESR